MTNVNDGLKNAVMLFKQQTGEFIEVNKFLPRRPNGIPANALLNPGEFENYIYIPTPITKMPIDVREFNGVLEYALESLSPSYINAVNTTLLGLRNLPMGDKINVFATLAHVLVENGWKSATEKLNALQTDTVAEIGESFWYHLMLFGIPACGEDLDKFRAEFELGEQTIVQRIEGYISQRLGVPAHAATPVSLHLYDAASGDLEGAVVVDNQLLDEYKLLSKPQE